MHIVLVTPEIPQNTGNIARTCAALGAELHLVHPLGFSVEAKALRRAGLDYWNLLTVHHYDSLADFSDSHDEDRLVLFSSKGATPYTDIAYSADSYLVFGSETRGLPEDFVREANHTVARIPTISEARCLNLSNAVAVAAYEVVRQNSFEGLETRRD